jgi:3-oxoacyl-[acyl-carrier protein] reductase
VSETNGGSPRQRGCALVTGASRGIGAAIAHALAADGWRCGVNFRSDGEGASAVVERIRASGGEAEAVAGDVRDAQSVESLFAQLEQRWGPVLCVVNNAGIRADGLSAMMSDDDWSSVIGTNLDGVFRVSRRALGRMIRARWGRIVNVSSAAGLRGSPGQANYSAAKAGLVGMTRTLAVELAPRGVTVNAVAPGFVETALTADVDRSIVQHVPVRRAGTPEEVAACVRFLVSDAAAYVTGVTVPVDGGLTA